MGLIKARFVDDMDWNHLAASYGLELEDAQKKVSVGLRRMAETLGGLPPKGCKPGCECKEMAS
jgi:hypothetical protein